MGTAERAKCVQISRIKILKSQEECLGENTLLCRGFANYRHLLQSDILP